MALQHIVVPVTCCCCRSSSLQFILFQPQTYTTLKFTVSCSSNQQTSQLEQVDKKKKKKNSRPSFAHQIRDKWSLNLGSQRDKFPWQEPEPEPEEEEEKKSQERQNESLTTYPLNFEFPKRLSPWHNAPENPPQFDSSESYDNVKSLQQQSSVMEEREGIVGEEVSSSLSERVNKKRSNTELAERLIPEHELRRLRDIALRMMERFNVGVAGITQELVASACSSKMDP